MSVREPPDRGAYGFRLRFREPGDHLRDLVGVDPEATTVSVAWRHASVRVDLEEVDDGRVLWGFRGSNGYFVQRNPAAICFDLPYVPPPEALVHPLLTVGISVLARWRGDVTLHGGAFQTRAGAWALMGDRRAGKSTLLASLGTVGYPILADDLLAIGGGSVWAGPSCVDLRPDVAERFADARAIGVIGGRMRFRLPTPNGAARQPLRGFFVLEWHSRPVVEVERLSARERLDLLYQQEYISLVGWPEPARLVPLLGLPAWRVKRPEDWTATEELIRTLSAVITAWEGSSEAAARPTNSRERHP